MAFSLRSGTSQDIAVMDWDGAGIHKVTSNGSQNLLPSWHPNGGSLLYTSFVRGTPDLWSVAVGGGKPRRISTQPGLNTGGVYSPDGSKIALTLSRDGNSEIYLISPDGAILRRLTNNSFIDSSPTWSPDGSEIAFVSDRYGTPQIWVMSASGSGQSKLTRKGNYNQEPSWAPRQINGQSLIAFAARDEKGAYDIFTVNRQSQEIVRLTENRGSNNHPTWAPNARAIAYLSSRGGIYAATADGKTERPVYRGNAEGPVWGPMPSRGR
jgi:TolB protein